VGSVALAGWVGALFPGAFLNLLTKGFFVARRLNLTSRLKAFDLLAQSLGPLDLTFLSVLVGHFSLLVKDAAVSNRRRRPTLPFRVYQYQVHRYY
jgi:hypothetical protein